MAVSALICDSATGAVISSLDDFESLSVTPRLGDASEARVVLSAEDEGPVEGLVVGYRALRVYMDLLAGVPRVLDDFNRVDEDPMTGWTDFPSGNGLEVISNQAAPAGTGQVGAYFNTPMTSPDQEAYLTIAAMPSDTGSTVLYARGDPAGGGIVGNNYAVRHTYSASSTDLIFISRHDASVSTTLAQFSQDLSPGDGLRIRCIGQTIEAWVRIGGVWKRIGAAQDATYPGTGAQNKLAIATFDPTSPVARWDDFGGGTVGADSLVFYGKLWEPLESGNETIVLTAKDPYAEFAKRRTRADVTYTSQDAGLIAQARLTAQNALWPTFLANGARQASSNFAREYKEGKLEGEIIQELAESAGGFFWKVRPVEGVSQTMGYLDILYPNAGAERLDVRFEYGEGTLGNVEAYSGTQFLPTNRYTAASSNATGGRISVFADDAASIALFGLFEDATTYSDVDDTALLTAQAQSMIRQTPPVTFAIQPAPNAPLIMRDFNVGDFVRLRIRHGALNTLAWVRVIEGTYELGQDGVERTASLVVESVEGGRVVTNPSRVFREQLDENRRRLEALERKVEEIDVTPVSPDPPDDGGGGDGPGGEPPDEPPPGEEPPAPPAAVPDVQSVTANGVNSLSEGRYIYVGAQVDPKDTNTVIEVTVRPDSGATPFNTKVAVNHTSGGSKLYEYRFRNEPSGSIALGQGTAIVRAYNSNGEDTGSDPYIVPAVPLD